MTGGVLQAAAWTARTFGQLPGRWRLVRWLEQHEREVAALPPQTVRFAGALRMRVDPRDENGRRVFVTGFDRRERLTRLFIDLLQRGDTVLDLGANVGYYTMVASHLVGPDGLVHAFEASPFVLPWLEASVRRSGDASANIRVHGVAVAQDCGEVAFHSAAPDKTGFSSIRDLGHACSETTAVPSLAIDSMLDELTPVRLVKMDIEGAELLALRGMEHLLRRDRPHIITEMDDDFLRQLGGSAVEMCLFLIERGYALHRIIERGDTTPLREPPTERCNVLATPVGA